MPVQELVSVTLEQQQQQQQGGPVQGEEQDRVFFLFQENVCINCDVF